MNIEEMDKHLTENEFVRISYDTWVYRLDYVNVYINIGSTILLSIQNVGTNIAFISRSYKYPLEKFIQVVSYGKNTSESLNKEITIFASKCSIILSREIQ